MKKVLFPCTVLYMNKEAEKQTVAFQGSPGAYSDLASQTVFPHHERLPCPSFEETFEAVTSAAADVALIPIENSIAGRVADIHRLLPSSNVSVIGEHFQPIHHCLLAHPTASFSDITTVHSHAQALGQCRSFIRENNLEPVVHTDTAGAAADISKDTDLSAAAIASSLAAETYGLSILAENIADTDTNITRFLVISNEHDDAPVESGPVITSIIFTMRSVPAALYKALGGFATNGINITKLESYITDESFSVAQFYADLEGHPKEDSMRLALEELSFFSTEVTILGTYPAHSFRYRNT